MSIKEEIRCTAISNTRVLKSQCFDQVKSFLGTISLDFDASKLVVSMD